MSTDRIEKQILLRAPVDRIWCAISDATEFGQWFGVSIDGPFVGGQSLQATIVPTAVDAETATLQEPYAGTKFLIWVEQIAPMRRFSFRWHPNAVEPGADYSQEPTTLVAFELQAVPAGTQLTISESGFAQIPLERRAKAFPANEGGWEHQTRLISKYLGMAARR